jgi:hypothetical protein
VPGVGGDARVFADDEVHPAQQIERALRDVTEIADRRRHQMQARDRSAPGLLVFISR